MALGSCVPPQPRAPQSCFWSVDSDGKVFVPAAASGTGRCCSSDCTYWLYPYLRVSQINERSTSVATSLLMSYGILDCRWQPSNNSSISQPPSLPSSSACSLPPPPRTHRPVPQLSVSLRLPLRSHSVSPPSPRLSSMWCVICIIG